MYMERGGGRTTKNYRCKSNFVANRDLHNFSEICLQGRISVVQDRTCRTTVMADITPNPQLTGSE